MMKGMMACRESLGLGSSIEKLYVVGRQFWVLS
jgi:hypothetical protein